MHTQRRPDKTAHARKQKDRSVKSGLFRLLRQNEGELCLVLVRRFEAELLEHTHPSVSFFMVRKPHRAPFATSNH